MSTKRRRSDAHMRTFIERAIHYNARCLGEAPTIGVHYLRDGRVRVFELDKGWWRRPYKSYRSTTRAYEAAVQSVVDARRVRGLLRADVDMQDAIRRVTERRRHLPWPTVSVPA